LYGSLVQDVALGGTKRKALVLAAPGSLSYYLDIPDKASLSLRVGAASGNGTARVRITPDDGSAPADLVTQKLDASWHEQVIPLASYAGKVVRLELIGEDAGKVAWASPSIVVADGEPKPTAPVQSAILLLIDTMRARELHPYQPSSRVETPAIDELAKEGTLFVNVQAPENWTKPSVASVLTGLYPATHGTKQSESRLPDGVITIAEQMKTAGVQTATFLANGYVSDKFGFNQGWDYYTNYIRENKSTKAENVFKDAGDWIEKHKDKRFFVYIQTIDPHVPYDPPEDWLKKYDPDPYTGPVSPRKTADQLEQAKRNPPTLTFNDRDRAHLRALYDGEVSYHDVELGKFFARLKQLGVYDKILFVLTADHGEEMYEHGSYGHGHSVYQELLHVPLIYRRPGVISAGKRIEETVSTVDVTPTMLGAMGIAIPDVMEGVDRNGHLQGHVPAGPAVAFSDFLDDRRVIRARDFKLILNGVNPTFFDLKSDPMETHELSIGEHAIARRYCRILIGQYLAARDRGDWLSAEQKGKSPNFATQAADIDEKTRAGLKALGYAN
jgi:arylsulfatase A-like enzyme